MDLAACIAAESAALLCEKQSAVLDFILFVKERGGDLAGGGDAAWERIINHPDAYPKPDAFLRGAAQEGEELLNPMRL